MRVLRTVIDEPQKVAGKARQLQPAASRPGHRHHEHAHSRSAGTNKAGESEEMADIALLLFADDKNEVVAARLRLRDLLRHPLLAFIHFHIKSLRKHFCLDLLCVFQEFEVDRDHDCRARAEPEWPLWRVLARVFLHQKRDETATKINKTEQKLNKILQIKGRGALAIDDRQGKT